MNMSFSKILPVAALLTSVNLFAGTQTDAAPKVLMVLSSYGEKDAEGKLVKPGYEFDEMTKSYLVFKSAGVNVTFASPKGGELITDNYDPNKAYNQQFLADKQAVSALTNTKKLSMLTANNYDAVYVVGGKGPMFDLAGDADVKRLIKNVYEDNGIVGAVCHGPAALLDVTLSDGTMLVNGKRVSAFTNLEETAFTKKWQLPFSLADKLKENGANYRQDGMMLNQVSIDGRLVTGQNPFSTADTARAVVKALGQSVPEALTFKDDLTIELVEAFFADRTAATKQFTEHVELYDPMLLGMFGLYQAKFAMSEVELDVAITLMELTQEIINHPMLDIAIAKAYLNKNNIGKASQLLSLSQQKFPDNEAIPALLVEINGPAAE